MVNGETASCPPKIFAGRKDSYGLQCRDRRETARLCVLGDLCVSFLFSCISPVRFPAPDRRKGRGKKMEGKKICRRWLARPGGATRVLRDLRRGIRRWWG